MKNAEDYGLLHFYQSIFFTSPNILYGIYLNGRSIHVPVAMIDLV